MIGILISVFIALLAIFFGFLFYTIRFTRQRIVDALRLNRMLKMKKAFDLTFDEVKARLSYIIWTKVGDKTIIRNGYLLREIHPMSAKEGHKYVVICRDNRPFKNVCPVTVSTDISGIKVEGVAETNNTKDYENMMIISGVPLHEIFRELRAVDAGDEEAKQTIVNNYITTVMREVL